MAIRLDKRIRMRMIAKDVTGAAIARKLSVDRSAINKAIKGEIKSFRLRKAIAEAIGMNISDLWPEVRTK